MSIGECVTCHEDLRNGEGLCESCYDMAVAKLVAPLKSRVAELEAERLTIARELYAAVHDPDWRAVDAVRRRLDPERGGEPPSVSDVQTADPLEPNERAVLSPETQGLCCAVRRGTGGGIICDLPMHHTGPHSDGAARSWREEPRTSDAHPADDAWSTCVYGQCPNPQAPNSMFCSECLIRRARERQEHDQRPNEATASRETRRDPKEVIRHFVAHVEHTYEHKPWEPRLVAALEDLVKDVRVDIDLEHALTALEAKSGKRLDNPLPDPFRVDLDEALALSDALLRNGGEDALDIDKLVTDTSAAAAVIRSLVTETLKARGSSGHKIEGRSYSDERVIKSAPKSSCPSEFQIDQRSWLYCTLDRAHLGNHVGETEDGRVTWTGEEPQCRAPRTDYPTGDQDPYVKLQGIALHVSGWQGGMIQSHHALRRIADVLDSVQRSDSAKVVPTTPEEDAMLAEVRDLRSETATLAKVFDEIGVALAEVETNAPSSYKKVTARECLRKVAAIRERMLPTGSEAQK